MTPPRRPAAVTALVASGFATLAIAMGVGRFYYTPLLPVMAREYGFGSDQAGLIASSNFAGYLAGSLLMALIGGPRMRLFVFRAGLLASVATTLLMGMTASLPAWLVIRAVSGIASALAMISVTGIIAEVLSGFAEEALVGWVFAGVGLGIAGSALLVHLAGPALDASGLWIAAGLGCAALLPFILFVVRGATIDLLLRDGAASRARADRPPRRIARALPFWPLFASYTLEGLGYSVFATFIVAIVKARPGLATFGDFVWIITGLAVLPSCLFFAALAERFGYARALLLAFGAQIVGVILPVASETGIAALAGAFLFGGTFIPITLLTMPLGRKGLRGRGFAVLTAGFGLGQMVGPLVAGRLAAGAGGSSTALLGSAAVLAVGALCLAVAISLRPK